MTWKVAKDSRTDWYVAQATKHLSADVPRLFNIFNDPESWTLPAPRTRTAVETNSKLGYAFADGTKAEITFTQANASASRISVKLLHLRDQVQVDGAMDYWDKVIAEVAKRTLSEPLVAYSAPGKINLFFQVGPLREDGYHEVASVYQAVDLRETVLVEPSTAWAVEVRGDLTPLQISAVPTGEDNLVVKAAKAVAEAAGISHPRPVHFSIDKRVPVAGGMGGGSADAAAAVVAVNQLWAAGLKASQLREIAGSIGADVPFALTGGLAVGTGIGDKIEVIAQKGEYHWALVVDDHGLSTPAVFRRLDELRSAPSQDPTRQPHPEAPVNLLKALKKGVSPEELAPLLHNELQAAAITLKPELQYILGLVTEVRSLRAIVSGSGPTVAFLARSAQDAEGIANRLRLRGLRVIVTSAPANGAEPVS